VKEPFGGAHNDPQEMAKTLKKTIVKHLDELGAIDCTRSSELRTELRNTPRWGNLIEQ
jgi:acetyl-CoA carboxylase alpha subunit